MTTGSSVPSWVVVLIVVGFVLMDGLIMWALFRGLANMWNELARAYPALEPGEGAVRREFQSFKVGIFNMGYSVHVVVDDTHLHLLPSWTLRKIGGKAASVPWDDVRLKPAGKWFKGLRSAKIGKVDLCGPAWALNLAEGRGPDGRA